MYGCHDVKLTTISKTSEQESLAQIYHSSLSLIRLAISVYKVYLKSSCIAYTVRKKDTISGVNNKW